MDLWKINGQEIIRIHLFESIKVKIIEIMIHNKIILPVSGLQNVFNGKENFILY
jgi:hypothetical protein